MSASDLSVLDFDVTMPKCAVCGADTGFLHNKLCTQCTADGLLWAARQARTPNPRSQVEKLAPKAGDLIVLRLDFAYELSLAYMGKLDEAFPGVTFLVMPLESSVEVKQKDDSQVDLAAEMESTGRLHSVTLECKKLLAKAYPPLHVQAEMTEEETERTSGGNRRGLL